MKTVFLTILAIASIAFAATAQESKTMYIMKNGKVAYQADVSEIDSLALISSSFDEGVVINGIKWATRNVSVPGTFAANPEDAGMFYQWNRKTAWAATGEVTGWDSTTPTGDTWEKANDPSPSGWRVPTSDEIQTLLDNVKVSNEWTHQNSIYGRKFTDIATGKTLFLPAVGYRSFNFVGFGGYYWSCTPYLPGCPYYLGFSSSDAYLTGSSSDDGRSVRSVSADGKVTGITINPTGNVSVEIGKTTTLTATVAPFDAANKNVTWSSLNPDIATVDEQTGVVTGVNGGTTTIRATAADGYGVTADKSVTVSQPISEDINGVVINGIRWATRNVDAPGTFTANPEDSGMFYQWNRKIGWSATDPIINTNGDDTWDNSIPTSYIWEKINDPSPAGWRIPTENEFYSLLDNDKVCNEWTTENGINGMKFIDKSTGKTLFLPAVGYRYDYDGYVYSAGAFGCYWGSIGVCSLNLGNDYLGNDYAHLSFIGGSSYGYSVRSVAEN